MSLTLIVTGMHRSGTSLTASFIQSIGVNLGESLFQADTFNVKGYFEDTDFLEFQRSVLQACCRPDEPGWADWGWTESEWLDRSKFENYTEAAKDLIKSRQEKYTSWGWKDPRTTLMLDFWHQLLPDAKYLFVYRFPWNVADSIRRLNAPVFLEHPDYAPKIWTFYNRHLLDFYQQHTEQCILLNADILPQQPYRLIDLLKNKLGLQVTDSNTPTQFQEIYDTQIFNSLNWNATVVRDLYNSCPQSFELLAELDRVADIPSHFSLTAVDWYSPPTNPVAATEATSESVESSIIPLYEIETPKELTKFGKSHQDENKRVISIVIPCFNQGEYILEAISSVESCQDDVYEIIIVNDGSTEPLTLKVLHYLKDKGYFVIDHPHNQGLAQARNTGIDKANGKYILPLDCDNRIKPEYLIKGSKILDKYPQVGVVYGNAQFFGERTDIWQVPDFDINKIVMRNYIDACAVFRKTLWEDCGGYDSKIPDKLGYEDWDFWLGAAEKGWKFRHLPEVLFYYRVRSDSMVSQCRIPENHERLVRYIATKHLDLYTTNFATILAAKDAALLREEIRSETLEMQLQETQTELLQTQQIKLQETQEVLAQTQEELRQTHATWEQANAQVQRIHAAWEQAQEELRQTHAAWQNSQEQLKQVHPAWERSQAELQQIYTAWNQAQVELQNTHAAWQNSQAQLQRIHTAWEQAQEELRQTHAAWHNSQEQVQNVHAAWQNSQEEFQRIHAAWQNSQEELQRIHAAWQNSQEELQRIHAAWEQAQVGLEQSQSQLQQTQTEWERSQAQLQHTKAELEKAQTIIRAMKSSKFWQVRNAWVRLKRTLGLGGND